MSTENDLTYDFIGWVPCISGSLNFRLTACDVIGSGYSNINHIELDSQGQQKRFIVIASKVDWEDFKSSSDGQWNVVLLASGKVGSDYIDGQVYLVPAQNSIWQEEIAALLKNIELKVFQKEDIKEAFAELAVNLGNGAKGEEVFASRFRLKEIGFVYLGSDQKVKDGDTTTRLLICRQSFYFIKYTFHKHKHHESSESLTTIHRLSAKQDTVGKALIGDIKRCLVDLRRDSAPADFKVFFASKGILSYAKSLAYSCKVEGLLTDACYNAEKNYIDNLGESLEILGRKIEAGIAVRGAFNANFRSIGLFVFAVLAPFTLLFKDEIRQGNAQVPVNHIVQMMRWIVLDESHLLVVLAICIVLYISLRKVVLRYGSPNLAAQKYHQISVKTLDFVTNNERSSHVLMLLLYVLFAIAVLSFLYRLCW